MQLRIKDNSALSLIDTSSAGKSEQTAFLKSAVTVLFRRKWLVITIFIITAAGATAFALLTPNRYKSSMKILLKNERVDAAVSAEEHTWTDRKGVSEEAINSEIELLKSKDLVQQVAEKLHLDKRNKEPGLLSALKGRNANGDNRPMGLDDAIQNLQSNLEVSPVKKADIIEITYVDTSPEMSAAVLKQLATDYLDKHLKLHQIPGALQFFKDQSSTSEQQLRAVQGELTGFRKRNEVTDLETQKKLALNYQSDLEKVLMKTEADIQDAGKKIEQMRQQINSMPSRILTQSREIPNQFAVERFNSALLELRNKRTLLLTKFREDDRLVQEVDTQIQDTKVALEKAEKFKGVENQTDQNPVRQGLEPELHKTEAALAGLRAQKETLSRQLGEYQGRLKRLEEATLKNNELERNLKQTEDAYKLYSKKEEEARIAEALDQQKIANVMIAESPTVPLSPFKPNRPLTMALGLLMGLFGSVSAAFMLEYFNDSVRTSEDLEALVGLPVLATIPAAREYKNIELKLVNPIGLIAPVKIEQSTR